MVAGRRKAWWCILLRRWGVGVPHWWCHNGFISLQKPQSAAHVSESSATQCHHMRNNCLHCSTTWVSAISVGTSMYWDRQAGNQPVGLVESRKELCCLFICLQIIVISVWLMPMIMSVNYPCAVYMDLRHSCEEETVWQLLMDATIETVRQTNIQTGMKAMGAITLRSEERRVGKEGRSRGRPDN